VQSKAERYDRENCTGQRSAQVRKEEDGKPEQKEKWDIIYTNMN
jgi:hypothetical protein